VFNYGHTFEIKKLRVAVIIAEYNKCRAGLFDRFESLICTIFVTDLRRNPTIFILSRRYREIVFHWPSFKVINCSGRVVFRDNTLIVRLINKKKTEVTNFV